MALRRCSPSLHTPLPRRPLLLRLAGRLPALLRRRKSRLPGGPGGAHSPVRPWRTHLSHRPTPPRLDSARRERISSQRTGCEQVHAVAPDGRHGGVRREGRGPLLGSPAVKVSSPPLRPAPGGPPLARADLPRRPARRRRGAPQGASPSALVHTLLLYASHPSFLGARREPRPPLDRLRRQRLAAPPRRVGRLRRVRGSALLAAEQRRSGERRLCAARTGESRRIWVNLDESRPNRHVVCDRQAGRMGGVAGGGERAVRRARAQAGEGRRVSS